MREKNRQRILVITDRFVPASLALSKAFYHLILECGYDAKIFMDTEYQKYLEEDKDVLFDEKSIYQYHPEVAIFLNVSLKIPQIAKKLKKSGCSVCYIYHEPYAGHREMKKEKENLLKSVIRVMWDNYICRKIDLVLLPSERSFYNYQKYCIKNNCNFQLFPLIFPDDICEEKCERKYFSYIGSFSSVHNAQGFVNFMHYAYKNQYDIKFMIATRSNIEAFLKNDILQKMIARRQLIVRHGKPMTTDEINCAYQKSICVWNVYNKSTQSGVLGNAFMLGTPVIASKVGIFEKNITNGSNGILIKNAKDMSEIYHAYQFIKEHLNEMTKNVQETYMQTYHYSSQSDRFMNLIEQLRGNSK